MNQNNYYQRSDSYNNTTSGHTYDNTYAQYIAYRNIYLKDYKPINIGMSISNPSTSYDGSHIRRTKNYESPSRSDIYSNSLPQRANSTNSGNKNSATKTINRSNEFNDSFALNNNISSPQKYSSSKSDLKYINFESTVGSNPTYINKNTNNLPIESNELSVSFNSTLRSSSLSNQNKADSNTSVINENNFKSDNTYSKATTPKLQVPERQRNDYIKISVPIEELRETVGISSEDIACGKAILKILKLRDKYINNERSAFYQENLITKIKPNSTEPFIDYLDTRIQILSRLPNTEIKSEAGILIPFQNGQPIFKPILMQEYYADLMNLEKHVYDGSLRAYCHKRLEILDLKWKAHQIYNLDKEADEAKKENHRDFYNIRKVDTHIHLAASFPVRKFMRFITNKLENEPDTLVLQDPSTKEKKTLKQVFDKLGITTRTIDIDSLDMQADVHTFQRFDNFNKKYNPLQQGELRNIFLQLDNMLEGRFFAELTKKRMRHFEKEKYEFMEWRVSVPGKSPSDANKVANWIIKYDLFSHNNRWLIQVPRLYSSYRKNGLIQNFAEMLQNIFKPLFDATLDPQSNPNLFKFLLQVTGFDSVDDESIFEITKSTTDYFCNPDEWTKDHSPPYCYWNYYFYINVQSLNSLRKARGLNTFHFRPHCGEAGPIDHLASSFLLADGISHGIQISQSPVLEYLYYLKQIGLAVSPISNNKLFVKYAKNPFPSLFARGLNVSLSTDDPLILHSTNDSLLEEYAVASEIWSLSPVDLCEIAKNSVIQSGYEETLKKHWLGERYNEKIREANDITKTNIPMTRSQFRLDNLNEEYFHLEYLAKITN